MEMSDDAVEVVSFVAVAAASVDAECAALSSSTEARATFAAKSRRSCCSRCWKLWLMIRM
jgi:hypothetical protein